MSQIKQIIIREAPRLSLFEAQITPLMLPDGAKIMSFGNTFPPHHNRRIHATRLAFVRAQKPDLIIIGGGFFSAAAFDSIMPSLDQDGSEIPREAYNLLHTRSEAPEVEESRRFKLFEDRVEFMGRDVVGKYIRSFAEAAGCPVIVIPSVSEGSRGWKNDHRIFEEKVHMKKAALDSQSRRQKDATKHQSDPNRKITTDWAKFLGLPAQKDAKKLKPGEFLVLHPNGGLLINEHTLFIIGKRALRQPGEASMRDWGQYTGQSTSIVRFHDGKVAENFLTLVEGSVPDYVTKSFSLIECGHGYDPKFRGDLDDYDFRAPGFVMSEVLFGQLATETIPELRGADGIYRFYYDGQIWSTASADRRGYRPGIELGE